MGAMPPPEHSILRNDDDYWNLYFHGGPLKKEVRMMQGLGKRGCKSRFMLQMFASLMKSMVYRDRTRDPGFAKLYVSTMKKEDGGSTERFAEMDQDAFMVSTTLEAYLYGMNFGGLMMCDAHRFFSSWGALDECTITAPLLVFNGGSDKAMPATLLPFFSKMYPQAQTTVLPGHGHSTMFLELRRVLLELTSL